MSKTLYLCGPINGCTDAEATDWREIVKSTWTGKTIDPMARDYRGRELEPGIAAEIVAGDLADIQASDIILVFYEKPSVGTSMEIFYAKFVLKKPVIVVNNSKTPLSPWLVFHSDAVVKTMAEALEIAEVWSGTPDITLIDT